MRTITKLDKARTSILLKHPFFASLMYEAKFIPTDNPHIPTAGITDDFTCYYNEAWFESLTSDQAVFLICHELMHPMLHHFTRRGSRNPLAWNYAGDEVINDILVSEGIGTFIPGGVMSTGARSETTEERYRKLEEQAKQNGSGSGEGEPGNGQPPGGPGHDIIDAQHPSGLGGKPKTADERKQTEQKVRNIIAKAALAAKSRGQVSGALGDLIEGMIEVKTPWHEILRHLVDSYVRGSKTWLRPNRRYASSGFYLPSTGRDPAMGHLVIGRDISGSVSKNEADHFTGHCAAIIEAVIPEKVTYTEWDTRVAHVTEYEPDQYPPKFPYHVGGGTYAPCLFDWIAEKAIEPCMCIMLTDGETDFGQDPGYPVIWVISNPRITAPWGVTVHFEMPR